jgi:adenylylsulfate kinase-like enzyme
MTGINSAYEAPEQPNVVVKTESEEMDAIVNRLAGLL